MPRPGRGVSLEQLRKAVHRRARATSLRQVAREVSMSPSGLRKFMQGARPYSATRRKLERWYVRRGGGVLGPGTAREALELLAADFSPAYALVAMGDLARALGEAYRRGGLTPPAWLHRLQDELEGRAP